jgi:hypothetical protein
VGVHRSRFELEQVLDRYGATELAFVETDASAAIQFAMDGRYVELALPLPDPHELHFTHTASGRPRAVGAQERAYEQALREHWRGLLLAVRGKLQSVESGLSTFEDEFRSFLAPHLDEKKTKRERQKPRAVNWLLGGSHSLAIALVAAFLVPASAIGAFALPPTVVGHLAAPFRGALPHELDVPSDDARAVALGQSIWSRDDAAPTHLARPSSSAHRRFAATRPEVEEPALAASTAELGGLRYGNEAPAAPPPPAPSSAPPPSSSADAPAPAAEPPALPAESGSDSPGPADAPPGSPPSEAESESTESEPADDALAGDDESTSEAPTNGPENGQDDGSENADPPAAAPPPPPGPPAPDNGKDKDNGHDNGNHNGADNGNKNGNGNGNGKGNGH